MNKTEAIDRQLARLVALKATYNEFTPFTLRLTTDEQIKQLQDALMEVEVSDE